VTGDSGVRIEAARASDTPVIHRMLKALVDYQRLSHEFTVTEAQLKEAFFGPRPAAEVVLGYAGAEPVGFAIYFPTFSSGSGGRGLFLEDLYVEPQWRGRGFGKKLLAHVCRVAAERGDGGVSWAVIRWNDTAIRFYRSLGAEHVEDALPYRLTGDALARLVAEG
jgi:GNAT superfamily N-acetyltransferase